jgi:superfamily II DNA or RNA helicase
MSPSDRPEPLFRAGDRVVRRKSPDVIGEILSDPDWDLGDWWYEVRFARGRATEAEFDLQAPPEEGDQVEDLAMQGRWGKYETLRRAVAVERILRQNRSTVYAFNAQRIRFLPHQYRPLLKTLESEDRRLLIADEVGLGKTIEAGLILSELRARQKLDRVLVICPSRLREKWRDEMERKFRQEFDIWGSEQIRDYVGRVQRNPRRSRFQAIASIQMLRAKDLLDDFLGVTDGLDLLIFDEAHHARNRSTATSRMVERLSTISDGFLMLTATPLHLGTDDLFNLLRLLREREFADARAFAEGMRRNEGVVLAQRAVRRRSATRLAQAAAEIRRHMGLFGKQEPSDPLIGEVLAMMEGASPEDAEAWLDLERLLEHAHVLSHVFTRTKKRDVYELTPERQGHWRHIQWTAEEHEAYCRLAGFDPTTPLEEQTFGLGRIQRARQAASSIHGTLLYRRRDLLDVSENELSDLENGENDSGESTGDESPIRLPKADSKFEEFKSVVGGVLEENPDSKILVFTFFIGTAHYLCDRLNREGVRALRIGGDVPSKPRRPTEDERGNRIRQFREDDSIRVLVSTEVGSEGLDFEFCSFLINYDLPWNPMVVEQRIGRIDRFGQQAEKLHIFSLAVENTIEDRILQKLYDRIGLFERAIGDLESILGNEIDELRRDYFSGRLTAAELERKAEEKSHIIAKRIRDARELEEQAGKLVGHEDYIREEVRRIRRLGRFVTPEQIRAVLQGFLETHHPDIRIQDVSDGVFRLRLTDRLLQDIEAASPPEELWAVELRMWSRDGYLYATTMGDKAYDERSLSLLNATHPLVRAAAKTLEGLLSEAVARVGSLRLRRESIPDDAVAAGTYFLTVFVMSVSGVRDRRVLETFASRDGDGEVLVGDPAERLLYLCLEYGEEHPERENLPPMPEETWRAMVSAGRARKRQHQDREERDNRSLYERRRQRYQDERDRKLGSARQRLSTLREKGRAETMIQLAAAQIDRIEHEYQSRVRALEESRTVEVELQLPPTACCVVEVI